MDKKYRVIGNSRFDHCIDIGTIVTLERVYPDGVFEVFCEEIGISQHVHPTDLEEIKEDE